MIGVSARMEYFLGEGGGETDSKFTYFKWCKYQSFHGFYHFIKIVFRIIFQIEHSFFKKCRAIDRTQISL